MTYVRFKNRPNGVASFNNLISDVFPQMPSLLIDDLKYSAPVNIKETDKEYLIELVAPGMNKEDFNISLEADTLTIWAEKKEKSKNENEKEILNEFKSFSCKRSFTINEKVDAESISALYVNGVLNLNLPKKQEVKPTTKQINIQ